MTAQKGTKRLIVSGRTYKKWSNTHTMRQVQKSASITMGVHKPKSNGVLEVFDGKKWQERVRWKR